MTPVVDSDAVTIRPVEKADLLDVFRIEKASFPEPWPYAAFERYADESGFLVAVWSAEVIGFVVSDVMPNYGRDVGHIKDLAVRGDARGYGVGRRLLDRAVTTLALDGATLVKLEARATNEPALSLYRGVGFEPMRRVPRYYGDGEDALVMVLDVDEWRADAAGE